MTGKPSPLPTPNQPLPSVALASLAKPQTAIDLDENRRLAFSLQIVMRLPPALGVVVDPPSNRAPHLRVGENRLGRFVDPDAEFRARPLHQRDEFGTGESHRCLSRQEPPGKAARFQGDRRLAWAGP